MANILPIFSQTKRGLGVDAAVYSAPKMDVAFHYGLSYNWMLNKRLTLSAGAMLFHTKTDAAGWNDTPYTSYLLDEETVIHLNAVVSATIVSPTVWNTGLYFNGSAFAQPIPLDYVSITKTETHNNVYKSKDIGKYRYSKFTPGAFAEAGIYHDIKRNDRLLRLFLGFAIGYYDPYSTYRNTVLDGQTLSPYFPENNVYYRLALRIFGF
jgi:hypothetical protein